VYKNINILGLDLSTNNCSVALSFNNNIEEVSVSSEILRSQKIIQMINELLSSTKLKPMELTAIAFGAGPGSFTGLKIASSIMQGLHLAWQKPIIKISTLWALALQGCLQSKAQYILPCIDAKMGQLYYGLYSNMSNSLMPCLLQPDALEKIQNVTVNINNSSVIIVGDGYHLLQPAIFKNNNIKLIVNSDIKYVQATSIVKLAIYCYKNNLIKNYNDAEPIYLNRCFYD
jgi:tRNA threonylcarbamoyladenosine biosynthesis protein TsaB